MNMQAKIIDNGVNVEALLDARQALTAMPEAAQFKWRTQCEWVRGTHSRSTVQKFFGLGEEQSHCQTFELDSDHPEIFASEDKGISPVEYILIALAGCLTAGIASIAQNRNIQLRSATTKIEGDMDLQGVLGIDPDIRNGYSGIRVEFDIDADASREDIEALVAQSQKRSAVFDILTNPTLVSVAVK